MTNSDEPLIEVRNLVQTLGGQPVLQGVSIDILRGETLTFMGRSGSGKSVFLRHLIGLMKPLSGSIRIDGEEITGLGERALGPIRAKIGMLFQDGALFDSLTVGDNVAFPLRERGERNESVVKERVAEALELMNMGGQQEKMPVNLSGGMRKRVALARAIITKPSVILYDEPTAGLDPIVSDSINKLIRRLQRQLSVTSIVVTHDMISVQHVADRAALLYEGKIRFLGSLKELNSTEDRAVRDFVEGRSEDEE